MAAFKRLIQLESRLRAIHVGSTMKTPPLRRTSVNSYSWLSSSSSDYGPEYYRKQEQIRRLVEQGMPIKQAEAITSVLDESHESLKAKMQKESGRARHPIKQTEAIMFLGENAEIPKAAMQKGPDFAFHGHEFTKLQNDIGKMRKEMGFMNMELNLKRQIMDMEINLKRQIMDMELNLDKRRAFRDRSYGDETDKLILERAENEKAKKKKSDDLIILGSFACAWVSLCFCFAVAVL